LLPIMVGTASAWLSMTISFAADVPLLRELIEL